MLRQQVDVTRIKLLGFLEIGVALIPMASPSFDIGQSLRNSAVIGQEAIRLLKVSDRGVVILQAGVMIKSFGEYDLAKIGL